MDCGPTCLKMILKYHGIDRSLSALRKDCFMSRKGSNLTDLALAAEKHGLKSIPIVSVGLKEILDAELFPSVIPWNGTHFVVLCAVKKKRLL